MTNSIAKDEMNPIALQIGELIGLFIKNGQEYTFNGEWFGDPWKYISAVPSKPELFSLISTLMGDASGSALGTPEHVENRIWYPILNPFTEEGQTPQPTGVYLVTTKPVEGQSTEMGFGTLYTWKYDSFTLLPYAYFPLLLLPKDASDSFTFILGQDGHPVETGIDITGGDGAFNTGNGNASLSFDGFKAGSQIYFTNGKIPSLDLTFINLKLPGEKQGSNRSLFDLIANASVQESITLALTVLGGQLTKLDGPAATAGKMIQSVMELLGLLGPVPGIDWDSIIKKPEEVTVIFTNWLQNIMSNNDLLKAWLNDWYCLFKGKDSTDGTLYISGEGTRLSPFTANLLTISVGGKFDVDIDLSFATQKTTDSKINIYPGFSVASSPITPIDSMPEFGVSLQANAEVLCYTIPLSTATQAQESKITFFPQYSIMASAANTDKTKPLFSVTDTFGNQVADEENPSPFSIDSMNVGFVYDIETATSDIPSPNFRLYGVQTAIGSWPVIDLANFNAKTIEEAIGPVVSNAIKSFFGEDNKYAQALTAVLGIDPPKEYTSGDWPLKDKMLLSADELDLLIKNPFAAIGAYYSRCLTTKDSDDKPLFQYIVPNFATLMGSDSTSVTGKGTVSSPWQVPILKVGTATLNLGMWQPTSTADTNTDLGLSFDFTIPLTYKSISATFDLGAEMMVMKLPQPDGSGTWDAAWMQALTGKLLIKANSDEKLQTPAIGGVSVAADDIYVQGGWRNTQNFFVEAGIEALELDASSGKIELGNLVFGADGWSTEQLKQFTPAIVNGLGLLMLENGGRMGVALTTLMGMLPNLPQIIDGKEHPDYNFPTPVGIALPQGWPVLTITNFENPWTDLKTQLSNLYADSKYMEPLMRMMGWAITNVVPAEPTTIPTGSMTDPWSFNLPDVFNIDVLTWKQDEQTGYGVQRNFAVNAAQSVQLATLLRADIPGFMLDGSTKQATNNYPNVSLVNIIQNPTTSKPLLELGEITIGKVQIGGILQLQNGSLTLIPVFRFLNSKWKAGQDPTTIEIVQENGKPQFTCDQGIEVFNSLINALMGKLSETINAGEFEQLQAFLDILTLLELLDKDATTKVYSFNQGAWASVLANPGGYFSTKTLEVLENDQKCAQLVQSLAQLMGYQNFDLPETWQGVQYLLKSLSLAKDYNGYFIPQFNNWLALINNPVNYLQSSVTALFNDGDLIKYLVTALTKIIPSTNNYFSVDTSGTIVTVQIPQDKTITIGNEVQLFASTVIDTKSLTITNSFAVGSVTLSSALSFQYAPSFKNGALSNAYGFYLQGLPGTFPQAFEPLPLWPFPTDTTAYLKQIGTQVPITLLSSFSTKYLNDFVVPGTPSVKNIFKVLGLTSDVEGTELIKPLTGILMHPVDWLMSPAVLGNGSGGISLDNLGKLLYAITDAAGIENGDIKLSPYEHDSKKDGVQLTGLPWGVGFTLYANESEGANLHGTFVPKLPTGAPTINLGAGIGFGTPNGLAVDGSIDMTYDIGNSNTLGITATYAKQAFTLTAKANTAEFKLLPFGGLNQFISGETAGALLKIIGDKLFDAYNEYVTQNPTTALKPFVESISTLTGITNGQTLYNFFDAIYKDPLGQFTEANIIKTLPRINTFVSDILKLEGFSVISNDKLLQYEHTFTTVNAKAVVLIGLKEMGGETVFGLWLEPVASYEWISIGLSNTGVGVVMPDYLNPKLKYEVNITVGANFSAYDIPNAPQPTLEFGLTGDLESIQGPNLNFYPVTVSKDDGTLSIELLPTPQLQIAGRTNVTVEQWIINFGVEFLVPFVANTALSITSVKNWLDKTTIGGIEGIPGKVLTDWGLLTKKDSNYYLSNLKTAFDLSKPLDIVTKLIFSALNILDGKCVVPIKTGGIFIQSETEDNQKRYGLLIQITDIEVTSSLNADGAKLVLQLGKYFGNQTKSDNWTGLDSEPGVAVYFITQNTDTKALSFLPKFELISIGLDFAGANDQKPLINTKGVSIQSVQPRAYVSLDINGLKTDFGGGVMLYHLGVPLGPGFDSKSDNTNPVAQNLVASGGNKGTTDAINPSFSVSASYVVNSKNFELQLYDANDLPTDKIWISIMRAFGPLQCRKIGIGWKGDEEPKRLDFLFDGEVSLAGLMMNLVELDIGIPISNPTAFDKYSLDLAGLDISYNAGAVSIGGGFLKDDSAGYIQYTGQAHIQTASFGVGAFGAYALIDSHPSLFIFAYLNAPIGGPPYFFINGLSGGFGYNRTINIPPANQIENFPFVAGIDSPSALGGKDGKPPTNEEALKALGTTIVPPKLGSYWLAAGLNVASFELIQSKAVLMVIFGDDFEIALVGISGLKLPKKGYTYVGAEMAFKVTFKASTGLLAVEAVLTSASYVIDPNCKLTGGLAFYVWFKNQPQPGASAGEFVFTLGGYHPAFKKPAYFPDEPRLGFSWKVDSKISIKGGAYFALTGSAVMAGGSLEAVFKDGNLKAWFTAYADFLIMWNPFHYDISIGISVGASYTVKIIWTTTFKVELGADIHLWGPEMAGKATVHWWVISFTVSFGASGTSPNTTTIIDWGDFNTGFLPQEKEPPAPPQQQPQNQTQTEALAVTAAGGGDSLLPVQQVTHIKQVKGLLKELPNTDTTINKTSPTLWQIGNTGFAFEVTTVIPVNKITVTGSEQTISSDVKFGIRPMGSVVFGTEGQMSTLTFTMQQDGSPYTDFDKWHITQTLNGVPESMWGTVNNGKTEISAKIIPNALVGFSVALKSTDDKLPTGGPPMFPLSNLDYVWWPFRTLPLANNPELHPTEAAHYEADALEVIENTVMNATVVTKRKAILDAVVSAGINVEVDGRLDQMAAYASLTFQSPPMLGELGSIALVNNAGGAGATTLHLKAAEVQPVLETAAAPQPAKLRGVVTQYARPTLPSPVFFSASLTDIKDTQPSKGSFYDTLISNGWQESAIKQGTTATTDENAAQQQYNMYPGLSMLIDIDPISKSTITVDGDTQVFGAWFDEHNQLKGTKILGKTTELPQEVSQLILTGLSTSALRLPYAYGWHITSELTLVNPNALTGVGAIAMPDSPIRAKTGRYTQGYGLVNGLEMVVANVITKNDEQTYFAGIETLLPQGLKTVAVLIKNKDSDVAFTGTLPTVKIGALINDAIVYEEVTATETIVGLYETALLFDISAYAGNYALIYATPSDADTIISGVLGLTEDESAVKAQWKDVVLQPPVPDATAPQQQDTVITIAQ